jgi:hypothetical protein
MARPYNRCMEIKAVRIGDEGQLASQDLVARFAAFQKARANAFPAASLALIEQALSTLHALDRQYGGAGVLPLEGVEDIVAAALTEIARLTVNDEIAELDELAIGIALWAIRHEVDLAPVEPVANALARRANRVVSKQELAAVFGLMQGLITHIGPRLASDLERSNPERPWRILHVNFAIVAIRSEDVALMDYAFDAIEGALPDESGSFFAEAMARALAPGIAPAVRERIEARHLKWTPPH